MESQLIITLPDGNNKTVRLEKDRWSIGRAGENDLSYPDNPGLSRQHFVLEKEAEDWTIRDLGSKNGTFLNGKRILEKERLRPGDRIAVSNIVLTFAGRPSRVAECSVIFERSPIDPRSANTLSTSLDRLMSTRSSITQQAKGRPADQWTTPVTAFLRAGRELSLGRPMPELFQVILDLSIEAVGAERGVLLSLEGDHLVVQASRGEGFRISTTVRDRVLREKTSVLVRDVREDKAFGSMQSIVEQSVRTFMAAPLQTDDRVIGLIYVDSSYAVREFTPDGLDLLTAMANVAAIRIERERMVEIEHGRRRMAEELQQAAEIQRLSLPTSIPTVDGLELARHYVACKTVGGDYYDFVTYPDGRVAMMVGDVCGKGMPAALLMMGFQARVQVLAEDHASPAGLLERLNRILTAASLNDRFISFFLSVLDPASGEMIYCNAGHNPPLLVRKNGQVHWLSGGGPVLGILPGINYPEQRCSLDLGDVVVFYSDGVVEASNPSEQMFEESRLAEIVQQVHREPAEVILNTLTRAMQDWMAATPAADDITLVVARRVPCE
jgi:sigma-B regulation protein RsbU (phosphoserine phosphatase)